MISIINYNSCMCILFAPCMIFISINYHHINDTRLYQYNCMDGEIIRQFLKELYIHNCTKMLQITYLILYVSSAFFVTLTYIQRGIVKLKIT